MSLQVEALEFQDTELFEEFRDLFHLLDVQGIEQPCEMLDPCVDLYLVLLAYVNSLRLDSTAQYPSSELIVDPVLMILFLLDNNATEGSGARLDVLTA